MKEAYLTKLTVKAAEFYAYHGVKSEEQTLGGRYQVDLEMYYNSTKAVINDDVAFALNYDDAMFCVEDVINGQYDLIETIANEIINMLFDRFPMMQKATVRVRKYSAPIRTVVSYIEAEQTMQRTISE
jgi:dihydroneopterin aldolase